MMISHFLENLGVPAVLAVAIGVVLMVARIGMRVMNGGSVGGRGSGPSRRDRRDRRRSGRRL